jgi:hypothetical protein
MTAQPTFIVALSLLFVSMSCSPSPKCGGKFYYDSVNGTCRPCPMGATFEAGSCTCGDERVFRHNRCELPDGGMSAADDDAGSDHDAAAAADGCGQYCDFIHVCLGDNTLAAAVLPDVISTLHADDPTACSQSCREASTGSTPSPLASCIQAGRDSAQCAGDTSSTGLMHGIMLLAQCSRQNPDDPLRALICHGLTQSPTVASQLDFCD